MIGIAFYRASREYAYMISLIDYPHHFHPLCSSLILACKSTFIDIFSASILPIHIHLPISNLIILLRRRRTSNLSMLRRLLHLRRRPIIYILRSSIMHQIQRRPLIQHILHSRPIIPLIRQHPRHNPRDLPMKLRFQTQDAQLPNGLVGPSLGLRTMSTNRGPEI